MMPVKNRVGVRFGRLIVLERADNYVAPGGHVGTRWKCACDCGEITIVHAVNLRRGTTSCGCVQAQSRFTANRIHGESGSEEYGVWTGIASRCTNPRLKGFKDYGARGIRLCERWLDFRNFLSDMGRRPSPKHSIERVNNEGHYEPGNCVWATSEEQALNKRTTLTVSFRGLRKPLFLWAKELGLNYGLVWRRIVKSGWTVEAAFSQPSRQEAA